MPNSVRNPLERVPPWVISTVLLGVSALGILPFLPYIARAAARTDWVPHAPDLSLLASRPPQVALHLAAALTALAIGLIIMMRPKGKGLHKVLGWSWVIAMAATAVSSLFITSLANSYTLLHLLSGWVIIALPMAVFAIRRGNVQSHRRAMTGMFVGGLLIAGALTFLPGRLMWAMFFG